MPTPRVIACLVPLILAAGCGGGSDAPAPSAGITGTTWTVQRFADIPAPTQAATVRFDGDRVGGFGGCVDYSAALTLKEPSIAISDVSSPSAAGCTDPADAEQRKLVSYLQTVDTTRLDGDTLTLLADEAPLIVLTRAAPYGRWRATAIGGTPIATIETPSVGFAPDGVAFGTTGCSPIQFDFRVDGDEIATGSVDWDPPAQCTGQRTEDAFIAAIRATRRAERSGDTLVLRDGSGDAVVEFAAAR